MNLNFFSYIFHIPAIVIAMVLHNYVQALLTIRLGDDNFKTRRHLTFNPFKQLEIIGFILAVIYGFGWSAPIETNPFKYDDRKKGTVITNLSPILVNIIVGIIFAIVYKIVHEVAVTPELGVLSMFLSACAHANMHLALINLVPVYPFDGYRLLNLYLSPNARIKFSNYEKVLQIVVVLLLAFGFLRIFLETICRLIIRIY